MLSTEELLRKAVLDTSDFGGAGEAPLSVEQVTQFIELMQAEQVFLRDVRTVTSGAAKWQESIINFATRIAKPGIEATRLASGDRVVPNTGIVEISTTLLRGEVPVADEVFEDNVAGQQLAGTLERTIADRFGFDIEDLMVNGDVLSGDPYLAQFDGWFKQAKTAAGNNAFDATAYSQDYQEIFKQALIRMPKRFLRTIRTDGRYYAPETLVQKWRDLLASRGTPLGDMSLTGANQLMYQAIPIFGCPSLDAGIAAGSPDTSSVLLTNKNNLYAGFHRNMKFESWRDPREGATSFIVTARVDAKVAIPNATVLAYSVNVEP